MVVYRALAHRGVFIGALVLGLLSCTLAVHIAQACTIDGKPTAFADRHRAMPSATPATVATIRTYVPFYFPGSFHTARLIHFAEARPELTAVLPLSAMRYRLRWNFGDGTATDGWAVVHRYAHPGVYRVIVAAYYDWLRKYYPFDKVRIDVTE
jgi:hypothetical protein